jgi:hypothetical protein
MRSCSPGSWEDLLWRLRAEAAAAEAGDFEAVAALASGVAVAAGPADAAAAAEAVHLHERVVALLGRRLAATAQRLAALRQLAAYAPAPPPRLLDLRH